MFLIVKYNTQLALEQRGFDLCGSTYTYIFIFDNDIGVFGDLQHFEETFSFLQQP